MPTDSSLATGLPQIENLPRRSATEAKNRWGSLVREARALGTIAITNHDRVEVVILDAKTYRQAAALVNGAEQHGKVALDDLSAEFDRHIASLQTPHAKAQVEATMAAKGRAKTRSKGGAFPDTVTT